MRLRRIRKTWICKDLKYYYFIFTLEPTTCTARINQVPNILQRFLVRLILMHREEARLDLESQASTFRGQNA
jgi:hypothetical protein